MPNYDSIRSRDSLKNIIAASSVMKDRAKVSIGNLVAMAVEDMFGSIAKNQLSKNKEPDSGFVQIDQSLGSPVQSKISDILGQPTNQNTTPEDIKLMSDTLQKISVGGKETTSNNASINLNSKGGKYTDNNAIPMYPIQDKLKDYGSPQINEGAMTDIDKSRNYLTYLLGENSGVVKNIQDRVNNVRENIGSFGQLSSTRTGPFAQDQIRKLTPEELSKALTGKYTLPQPQVVTNQSGVTQPDKSSSLNRGASKNVTSSSKSTAYLLENIGGKGRKSFVASIVTEGDGSIRNQPLDVPYVKLQDGKEGYFVPNENGAIIVDEKGSKVAEFGHYDSSVLKEVVPGKSKKLSISGNAVTAQTHQIAQLMKITQRVVSPSEITFEKPKDDFSTSASDPTAEITEKLTPILNDIVASKNYSAKGKEYTVISSAERLFNQGDPRLLRGFGEKISRDFELGQGAGTESDEETYKQRQLIKSGDPEGVGRHALNVLQNITKDEWEKGLTGNKANYWVALVNYLRNQ